MTWIKVTERKPPETGWYKVVKFDPGTTESGWFFPVPPKKNIKYYQWAEKLRHEESFVDRVIYKRYHCFVDEHGLEQKLDEILYWYELDCIPEDV